MLDLKVLDHSHELIFRNADVEGVVVPVNRSVLLKNARFAVKYLAQTSIKTQKRAGDRAQTL